MSRSASPGSGVEARPAFPDAPLGPADELPAVRLRLAEDRGDLVVAVVEDPAQQVCRPLDRRQALEHDKERQRHRLGGFEPPGRDRSPRFRRPARGATARRNSAFGPRSPDAGRCRDGSRSRRGRPAGTSPPRGPRGSTAGRPPAPRPRRRRASRACGTRGARVRPGVPRRRRQIATCDGLRSVWTGVRSSRASTPRADSSCARGGGIGEQPSRPDPIAGQEHLGPLADGHAGPAGEAARVGPRQAVGDGHPGQEAPRRPCGPASRAGADPGTPPAPARRPRPTSPGSCQGTSSRAPPPRRPGRAGLRRNAPKNKADGRVRRRVGRRAAAVGRVPRRGTPPEPGSGSPPTRTSGVSSGRSRTWPATSGPTASTTARPRSSSPSASRTETPFRSDCTTLTRAPVRTAAPCSTARSRRPSTSVRQPPSRYQTLPARASFNCSTAAPADSRPGSSQ